MNISNENTSKKEIPIINGKTQFFFNDYNEKLKSFINNTSLYSSTNNQFNKYNINQKNNNQLNNNNENKDSFCLFKNNENLNYEIEKKSKRLDILKFLDDDSLSHYFIFNSPINNKGFKHVIHNPYSEEFNDNNIVNESIFNCCIGYDKEINEKTKIYDLEEIKDLKNNSINLIFGEQPCDVYYQLKTTNKRDKEKNLKIFTDYMGNLYKFSIKDPGNTLKENKIIINYGDNFSSCNVNEYNINKKYNNSNISNEKIDNSLMSNSYNNSNIVNNDLNLNNKIDFKNNKCILKRPILINNYSSSTDNALKRPIIINEHNKSNVSLIKKEMCDKYNINYKNKEKVDELIKEQKYEFKHKINSYKRGKFIKKKY